MIKTTLNFRSDVMDELKMAAHSLGTSRSDLIVLMLKMMMKSTIRIDRHKTVQYQEKQAESSWHRFHIRLREDDYEYFTDLRKFMKMSVSLILALAVKKFLKKLLDPDSQLISDNYIFNNYILIKDETYGIPYWKIFWGYPDNIADFIP